MNKAWLMILGVLVAGSVLRSFFILPEVGIGINIAVFGVSYLILKRHPYVDMKRSLLFLAGMLVLTSLIDMRMINPYLGQAGFVGLLLWMLFSGRRPSGRPPTRHRWHK